MQAYFETSDEVLINYNIHRTGSRPIVLMHGWGGQQVSLNALINEIKGDYTVISYDHRGFGKSDRPSSGYSIERLATDLKELLEHLDIKDALLLGWSMGGIIGSYYIDMYGTDRVAGFILVDVNVKILSDESYKYGFYDGSYKKAECYDDLVKMVRGIRLFAEEMPVKGNMTLFDDEMRKVFVEKVVEQNPDPYPCVAMWIAVTSVDLTEIFKSFRLPVLFLHGGTSTYCSPEACEHIKGLIKGVKVVEFPECSHFIPLERPAKVFEAIDAFAKEY